MVDKPGRRKTQRTPWAKIAGVVVVLIILGAAGWEVYWNYVYQTPQVYAKLGTSQGYV